MNTKITFSYKNVPYVLEYNRMAIKRMESVGFSLEEFRKKPMLNIDIAFKGLFLKNHEKTSEKLIDEIYSHFKDKEKLLEKMLVMLGEAYDSLFDNDENDEGNIAWDIVESKPTA